MSWHAVHSLRELATDADVIVIGTVTSAEPREDTYQPIRIDGLSVGLPFTVSTVSVENALRGAVIVGDDLLVQQEGVAGIQPVTSTSYTLLQVGKCYLLFLSPNQGGGTASPVGGPQGVYQITENTVYSVDGKAQGICPWLLGLPVDRAVALIAETYETSSLD